MKADLKQTHFPVASGRRLAIFPVALGIALLATNRWFTEVDDECAIVDQAARPVRITVERFLSGVGMHEHPPLYDLLLHGWLRLTAGNTHLLRVPAILFYVTGAWVLALVAKRLGGTSSQFWTLLIVTLSPFGFHFGRLATWYSCGFLLVCLLTLAYLHFQEQQNTQNWIVFVVVSLALVYTNYFGWAFLGLLALDYLLQNREKVTRAGRWLALTAVVLLAAYLPIFRAFEHEVHVGAKPRLSVLGLIFNLAYNLYLIFVSESVAIWFWPVSVLGVAAIGGCLYLLLRTGSPAKRFFIYFVGLTVFLAAMGILISKRSFFATPWLFLPLGVALGIMPHRLPRRLLLGGLTVCATIGWYGIFARNLYAAPHWVENWQQVARQSAQTAQQGGIVIGNNASFFFYLTYLLPVSSVAPHAGSFGGLLPESVRAANVYDSQQWIEAGRPIGRIVVLAEGLDYGNPFDRTSEAQNWLDQHCTLEHVDKSVHDSGAALKQKYVHFSQPEWRVQVRNYSCP